MAAMVSQHPAQTRDSLDALEDKIEYLLKFVTIISELVLLLGLAYAGFKLAHKGPTPETLDQIWLVSQVLALDLSAPGLFAMAAQARDLGEEKRAKWAIRIAIILIVMSILTMVEGAVTSYLPGIPQAAILYVTLTMMIIRGGAAVGYSVFRRLHKAEKHRSIAVAQPAAAAQQIDYEEIARQLLPTLRDELKQAIPYTTGLVEQLQQMRATVEKLATKSAPEVEPESTLSSEDVSDESASESDTETLTDARQEERDQERNNITLMSDRRSAQPRTTKRTGNRSEKASKAASIIKRNPQISAPDLAKKAQISTSYARKLLVNQ